MPSDIIIVPFNEKYISSVQDIMLSTLITEYKCNQWGNAHIMQDWRRWVLDQTYDYYKFYPNHFLMAMDNNKLVGFISFKKINDGTAEIKKLFVVPQYRKQGVAQKLYDKLMQHLPELGHISNIQLTVCAPFIEAVNFYEKQGFKITFVDVKKFEYRMERPVT